MTNFVKNAWYVAGWSTEIDDELRRFTILGEHVVMFRKSDGSVAALEDRCPHRLLPLHHQVPSQLKQCQNIPNWTKSNCS